MQKFNKSSATIILNGSKFVKTLLAVVLLALGIMGSATAQQNTITIDVTSTETVPADLIIFNIDVNAEAETPQEAFDIHSKRETLLAELLHEFDIREENIDFEPIRMHKRYADRNDSRKTVTNQQVSVTFSDLAIYEKIQVTLIENGFDSFNGEFSSTEIEKGKDKALEKAIKTAKEKAELIAKSSGIKLGSISSVNFSDHEIGLPRRSSTLEMKAMGDASMMDFSQSVSIRANISITFNIEQ